MSVLTPVGPLAPYFIKPDPPSGADAIPMACEVQGVTCTDLRPRLSSEVFNLRQRVGLRWLPRFGIFDPKSSLAVCRFSNGWIRSGEFWISSDRYAYPTAIRNRIDSPWTMLADAVGILIGAGTLAKGITLLCKSCGPTNPALGVPLIAVGVFITAAAMFFLVKYMNGGPPIFEAQYVGPIPPEVRRKARSLHRPFIIADARWKQVPAPQVEPYLVEYCHQGAVRHLHVVAWWDLSKGEMVIEEFITPATAPAEEAL